MENYDEKMNYSFEPASPEAPAAPQQPLEQAPAGGNIPDAIQQDLVILYIQEALGCEQPVLGEPIPGEAQGQPENTLPVLPQVGDLGFFHSAFPSFFLISYAF